MAMVVVCKRCRGVVDPAALVCRHCRAVFDPAANKARAQGFLAIVGLLPTCTVIGAVLGIPLLVAGLTGWGVKATPATELIEVTGAITNPQS